ncbi:toprim domain-containing protein [Ralstonia insidiosa]|nr:hypothetical protein [Ralstonia insidiosa]MBA9940903.1 hypothetical protein [Ralstonia insidiosa]MBC9969104.1 toprim domain-containing protein [Ralstonia insidiosa]MBX3905318.1 toprim domain-containing protein [Ralstonia insidiosa]
MIRDDNARRAARDAMIKDAKYRAAGKWRGLLESAGLDKTWLKKGVPCPFCGGRDRYSFTDKWGDGNYFCRGCGPGDGIKLLQFALGGVGFMEAIEWAIQWSGGSVPDLSGAALAPRPVFKSSNELTPAEVERRKGRYKTLWDAGFRVTKGDPVWKHLERRLPGLEESEVPRVLRFHPAMKYWEKDDNEEWVLVGTYPGMLAAIQGPDGVCCNIHRTFLTEDGEKAPVESARKKELSIGVKGGAIRLVPLVGREMSVAEGIETSLAVIRYRGESCWSAVDAGGMEEIFIPDEVELVRIYQDNDLPDQRGRRRGFDAGEKLAQRVKAMGKRAIKYAPGKAGMDMDDFVRSLPKRA